MDSTDDLRATWGAALRHRRQARGMTQRRLSFKTDVDQSWISKIEDGSKWPTVAQQVLFAAALGTTPRDLFKMPDTVDATVELAGIDPSEAAA